MMRYLKSVYVQVLIGIALGIVVGYVWPGFAVGLKVWGDLFVHGIKMVIAPVVFCTVTAGIAHMGDIRRLGKIGVKTLVYFEVVSTFALAFGLLVGLAVQPGAGFSGIFTAKDTTAVQGFITQAKAQTPTDFFLHLVPESFVGAFANGDLLQVVVISIVVGLALLTMGEKGRKAGALLNKASEVFFAMIGIVVRFAPLGAFGAMAYTVGNFGLGSLLHLAYLIGTFYGTSILFVVIVLGLISRFAGFSIFKFLSYIKEELLIVLGTSSSESALPQLMAKLEKLGVSQPVVGMVVPAGYSFNLDGTNIYMTLATLFLAQATHTALTPFQLMTLLVVAMLTSKGASGVTGAGFITLAATLSAVPTIPIVSLALLIGVDRFMSECRALTNIVGNGVGAIVLAGWEKELDRDQLKAELG